MYLSFTPRLLLLLCLVAIGTSSLHAQTLPREVRFPASDTIGWSVAMTVRTQGTDPKSREEVDALAGTDFAVRLHNARIQEDEVIAEGNIIGQKIFTKALKTPTSKTSFRDTSYSTAGQGIERYPLRFRFNRFGEMQELELAAEEPSSEASEEVQEEYMIASASLVKFRDVFKMVFMGLRMDGVRAVGDEWKMVETDTTEEGAIKAILRTVTTWKYERTFDTLGHSVGVLRYLADSVSATGPDGKQIDFMKLSLPSHTSHGTFYFDLASGLPVYASSHSVMEMTLDFGSFGDDDASTSKKKKKGKKGAKSEAKKSPTAFTMRMTLETEAVMGE
jgi:hypothetical protein